ncbi:MAG: hypothetical protein K5894_16005 [Lachnospiraceae bacterium]|nr:hypothetical protein [Lachnospiraceae bacterium]
MWLIKLMLKLIGKIILFPIYLLLAFVSFLAGMITGIGSFFLTIFYILMLGGFIMLIYQHMWPQLLVVFSIVFGIFVVQFFAISICNLLKVINNKIVKILFT